MRILALEPVLFATERDARWISFGVTDALAGVEAIAGLLSADGVRARFRPHTTSLEDAFVHHIGELAERFED